MSLASFRRSFRENFPQSSEHVRNAERLLEPARLAAPRIAVIALHQIARHVDNRRPLSSRGLKDAAGGVAAINGETAGRQMKVAKEHVVAGTPEKSESLFGV